MELWILVGAVFVIGGVVVALRRGWLTGAKVEKATEPAAKA